MSAPQFGLMDCVVPIVTLPNSPMPGSPFGLMNPGPYAVWALAQRRETGLLDVYVSRWGSSKAPSWRPLALFEAISVPFSLGWTSQVVPDCLRDDPHWNQYDRPYSTMMASPAFLTDLDYLRDVELGGPTLSAGFYDQVGRDLPSTISKAVIGVLPTLREFADPDSLVTASALIIAGEIELALDSMESEFANLQLDGQPLATHVHALREILRLYARN